MFKPNRAAGTPRWSPLNSPQSLCSSEIRARRKESLLGSTTTTCCLSFLISRPGPRGADGPDPESRRPYADTGAQLITPGATASRFTAPSARPRVRRAQCSSQSSREGTVTAPHPCPLARPQTRVQASSGPARANPFGHGGTDEIRPGLWVQLVRVATRQEPPLGQLTPHPRRQPMRRVCRGPMVR